MTTTSTPREHTTAPQQPPASGPLPTPPPSPPPKLRRRPAFVALGAVAICLGGLLAAWAWSSTTHTQAVLAARATIHRGELITSGDLERVRINADLALRPVAASAYDSVVGKRASLDIAAGALLTLAATTGDALPPAGKSIVGISLTPAQAPALPLRGGDQVRVIVTPGQNGQVTSGAPAFSQAQVVDSRLDASNGNTIVDLLVPYADAAVLAARAASGNVALVLDSLAVQ